MHVMSVYMSYTRMVFLLEFKMKANRRSTHLSKLKLILKLKRIKSIELWTTLTLKIMQQFLFLLSTMTRQHISKNDDHSLMSELNSMLLVDLVVMYCLHPSVVY